MSTGTLRDPALLHRRIDPIRALLVLLALWLAPTSGMTESQQSTSSVPIVPTTPDALGDLLFNDVNISIRRDTGCVTCHSDNAGFADPRSAASPYRLPVSIGSPPNTYGLRQAMSAAYATFSPPFHYDENDGTYVGGQFWDGRANTLADQALGPPLNPAEMALEGKQAVVKRLAENPVYVQAFEQVYGVELSMNNIEDAFAHFGKAIGAFEPTDEFVEFNSKYDLFVAGKVELAAQESLGLALFNGKAKCANCHVSEPKGGVSALFTDFTYDNLGIPSNPRIAELHGVASLPPDLGLGDRPDIRAKHPDGSQDGKFKVPTLRNIDLSAPYGHNGVFVTLEQIVHFYNTRDVLGAVPDANDPGFGVSGWPPPEVPQNVNTEELGNLGLTIDEEAAIVAFLKTLSDDFQLEDEEARK